MRRLPCPSCSAKGYIEVEEDEAPIRRVLMETAADFNITVPELCGPCRHREVVEARRHVARELRTMGLRLKEIGRWLGNRDHATIINLLNGKR